MCNVTIIDHTPTLFYLDAVTIYNISTIQTASFMYRLVNNLLHLHLCNSLRYSFEIHNYATRNAALLHTPEPRTELEKKMYILLSY